MPATKPRGDQTVNLGSLGMVHCRPGLRALEALDDLDGHGTLGIRFRRLALTPSLTDIVDILYETHVDAASATGQSKTHTRTEIGEAVLEVGMGSVRDACAMLILTAFGPVVEGDSEGNELRAAEMTPPPASPRNGSSVLQ